MIWIVAMLRVTFFFLFFENIPVVVDIQRIINKLLLFLPPCIAAPLVWIIVIVGIRIAGILFIFFCLGSHPFDRLRRIADVMKKRSKTLQYRIPMTMQITNSTKNM